MNISAALRTVRFGDRDISVAGRAGDPYFEAVSTEAFASGFFAWVLNHTVRTGATIFDVGANIGVTALMSSRRTSGAVVAFEPSPSVYPFLRDNIAGNEAANVTPEQLALGRQDGSVRFFDNTTSASASHLVADDTLVQTDERTVPLTTLDRYVETRSVVRLDLVKIDVEGFEVDVIAGAARSIAAFRPDLFVEFNPFTMIAFRNLNPRALLDDLRRLYPFIYRFADGRPVLMESAADELTFLHERLTTGRCVEDLYCSFDRLEWER